MLHFAGADAKGQRAKRAVGGRVAVAADDGHARLGQPQFRPDDVDDAPVGAVHAVQRNAEIVAVFLQRGDLLGGNHVS